MDNKLVIPGEFLSNDISKSGEGTYIKNGKVFSSFFGIVSLNHKIRVYPLSGKYIPQKGDIVIGVVIDITNTNWIVDIESPYDGLLHISEYPKKIDSKDMSKYLKKGDSILTLVKDVDASMKIELTLNDKRLKKIEEGRILRLSPSKIARLIGRNGSMIATLRDETKCYIKIGQNGLIWIKGKEEDLDLLSKAIKKIDSETHISGLTEEITKYLKQEKGEKFEVSETEKEKEETSSSILDELLENEK